MKKVICALSVCFIYSVTSQSQEKQIIHKKHQITIGYGYKIDANWWKEEIEKLNFKVPKRTDDIYLKYEYKINKKTGIGLDIGFMKAGNDEFGIFAPIFETHAYTASAIRILPSINYHFLNSSKINPYINIEMGYYIMNTKLIHYYPDPNPLNSLGFLPSPLIRVVEKKLNKNAFDFCAGIGLKYMFSKNIGIFIESGINKSIFQTGVVINF